MKSLFTIGFIAATIAGGAYFTQPNQSQANHLRYNSETDHHKVNTSHNNRIEEFMIYVKDEKEKRSEGKELKKEGTEEKQKNHKGMAPITPRPKPDDEQKMAPVPPHPKPDDEKEIAPIAPITPRPK